MKNILLPTDFSENSLNAINYAINLLHNRQCTFFILNVQKQVAFVLDDFMTERSNTSIHKTIAQDNKTELKLFARKIKNIHSKKDLDVKLLFDFDKLTNAINEAIVAKKIDLVIMGTNGVTGAREVIFGSNTLNVVRQVACPILIVPENYEFNGLNTVLFSVDHSKSYTQESLTPLKKVIKESDVTISVLAHGDHKITNEKVTSEPNPYINYLLEAKKGNYYKVENVPSSMVVSTIIQLFDFDIHALFLDFESSFLKRFLQGAKNQEISYKTTIPLLVLRS